MTTLSGKSARVKITAAAATSSTGETATRSTGSPGYVAIDSTAKRHFNRNNSTAFTLYLNTTAVSSTAYDLNPVLGRFEWKTGDPDAGTYTADVEYLTASYLGETQGWSLDAQTNMLDVTAFSTSATDTQWRTMIPGLSGATVSLDRTAVPSSTQAQFFDRLAAQQDVVVELWMTQAGKNKFEGFARVNGDSFTDPIDGLPTESVSLTIDNQLYHSTI